MAEFKFVCRQIELNETISSLTNSELVLLHSQNNSGLTHFLKKLMQLLWNDNSVCFYIDGESNSSISNQIIGQVALFEVENVEKTKEFIQKEEATLLLSG